MNDSVAGSPRRGLLGLVSLGLTLAYAGVIHHGVGPLPDVGGSAWWSPREFLLGSGLLAPFEQRPLLGVVVLSLPAFALAAATFATLGSALGRLLALCAALSVALFLFYGLRPPGPRIWSFFGWRGSAVMVGMAGVVAATALAPLLAASWRRWSWPVRALLYLPVCVGVVACLRNVTGTDPSLRFAISPWPVVTLFGLGVGATLCLGVLAGLALALAGAAAGRGRAVALAALVLGLATPVAWAKWSFPPLGPGPAAGLFGATALALLGVLLATGRRPEALRRHAAHVALGALLAGLPLLAGRWLVLQDYAVTRNERGQAIIEALNRYYAREGEYPDDLEQLIRSRDLAALASPRIGFGFLSEGSRFGYQNFGNSYLLEFAAPDWVQCAYNPPWSEEDYADDPEDPMPEVASGAGGADPNEVLPGSWSCPSQPPDLW